MGLFDVCPYIASFRPDASLANLLEFLSHPDNLKKLNEKMSAKDEMFVHFKNKSDLYRFLLRFAMNNHQGIRDFILQEYRKI